MSQRTRTRFVENLAAAFLAGEWAPDGLRKTAAKATGRRYRWIAPLSKHLLESFPTIPTFAQVLSFLNKDSRFQDKCLEMYADPDRVGYFPVRTLFDPPRPAWVDGLPVLSTEGALAEWLELTPGQLNWLSDPAGRNRLQPAGPLRTYRYRWVLKKSGRARLLEIPTPLLMRTQRKLLAGLLNRVPPHAAAHGFRSGCSVVTNAAPHCGRDTVLRFDLKNFFPSIGGGRVLALFRALGYRSSLARLLAGLCTTRIPRAVWDARPRPALDGSDHAEWQRLRARHLPQGAPSSPAVANLAAYRFDCRLTGLAADLDATYTRYADDLTFSGGPDLARSATRLTLLLVRIAVEEGFSLNYAKTRVFRRSGRQTVTGVVVNVRPNLPRAEYDGLKAVLTNCVRHGPVSQNREARLDFRAHLMGKVAHLSAINPTRGQKLWNLFDRIVWPV